MTVRMREIIDAFNKSIPDIPLFIRLRVLRLVKEEGLTSGQGAIVAREIRAAYLEGKEHGESSALYESVNKGDYKFLIKFGTFIRLHKVREHRVLEYMDKETDEFKFVAQEEREGHWGNSYDTFDAALVESIAMRAERTDWANSAGLYINRMLDLK